MSTLPPGPCSLFPTVGPVLSRSVDGVVVVAVATVAASVAATIDYCDVPAAVFGNVRVSV